MTKDTDTLALTDRPYIDSRQLDTLDEQVLSHESSIEDESSIASSIYSNIKRLVILRMLVLAGDNMLTEHQLASAVFLNERTDLSLDEIYGRVSSQNYWDSLGEEFAGIGITRHVKTAQVADHMFVLKVMGFVTRKEEQATWSGVKKFQYRLDAGSRELIERHTANALKFLGAHEDYVFENIFGTRVRNQEQVKVTMKVLELLARCNAGTPIPLSDISKLLDIDDSTSKSILSRLVSGGVVDRYVNTEIDVKGLSFKLTSAEALRNSRAIYEHTRIVQEGLQEFVASNKGVDSFTFDEFKSFIMEYVVKIGRNDLLEKVADGVFLREYVDQLRKRGVLEIFEKAPVSIVLSDSNINVIRTLLDLIHGGNSLETVEIPDTIGSRQYRMRGELFNIPESAHETNLMAVVDIMRSVERVYNVTALERETRLPRKELDKILSEAEIRGLLVHDEFGWKASNYEHVAFSRSLSLLLDGHARLASEISNATGIVNDDLRIFLANLVNNGILDLTDAENPENALYSIKPEFLFVLHAVTIEAETVESVIEQLKFMHDFLYIGGGITATGKYPIIGDPDYIRSKFKQGGEWIAEALNYLGGIVLFNVPDSHKVVFSTGIEDFYLLVNDIMSPLVAETRLRNLNFQSIILALSKRVRRKLEEAGVELGENFDSNLFKCLGAIVRARGKQGTDKRLLDIMEHGEGNVQIEEEEA